MNAVLATIAEVEINYFLLLFIDSSKTKSWSGGENGSIVAGGDVCVLVFTS